MREEMSTPRLWTLCMQSVNSTFMVKEKTPIDRLLDWADKKGLKDADLARLLGIAPQVLWNWKKRGIPKAAILDIAPKIRVPAERLWYGHDPEFDEDVLYESFRALRSFQARHNMALTGQQEVASIKAIYKKLMERKAVSDEAIIDLLRRLGRNDGHDPDQQT